MQEEINLKEYQDLLTAKKQIEIKEDLESYRGNPGLFKPYGFLSNILGGRSIDQGEAALGLLSPDLGGQAGFGNVEIMAKAVRRDLMSNMGAALKEFEPERITGGVKDALLGAQDKTRMHHLLRVIIDGADPEDELIEKAAKGIRMTLDDTIERFQANGGKINRLDNYFPNPRHDRQKIFDLGDTRLERKQEWKQTIKPLLDKEAMEPAPGQMLTDDQLDDILDSVYLSIVDENKRSNIGDLRSRRFANKHEDSRVLHFKDADSWIEYNENFGSASMEDALVGYVDRMSRDIAVMKRLGPKAKASKKFVKDLVDKRAREIDQKRGDTKGTQIADKVTEDGGQFDSLYDHVVGTKKGMTRSTVTKAIQSVGDLVVSSTIGSAVLKAIPTDTGMGMVARSYHGLSKRAGLSSLLKTFLDTTTRQNRLKLAQESALVGNIYSAQSVAQKRFADSMRGFELTKAASDQVLRKSLLTPWTQAARASWGIENAQFLKELKRFQWDELVDDPVAGASKYRSTLERYGITQEDWDIIQKAPTHVDTRTETELLRPLDLDTEKAVNQTNASRFRLREIKDKLNNMIMTEELFAVPSGTARSRITMTGNLRKDTLAGAIVNSAAMYKNFPISVMQTHMARSFAKHSHWTKTKYLGALMTATTLTGALGVQMSNIARGQDPVNMNPGDDPGVAAKFWWDAMASGGGLGLMGDLLTNATENDSFGRGLPDFLMGPVIAFAGDTAAFTGGNLIEAGMAVAEGEDVRERTDIGRETVDYLSRWMPGGNVFWWRLGLERHGFDQLRKMLDPEAEKQFQRKIKRSERLMDQEYYSEPGTSPLIDGMEAPNLSKAFGVE